MDKVDRFIDWFKCHKAVIGSFLLGLATIVIGTGNIYNHDQLLHIGGVIALIGGTLVGSGASRSDQFYREQNAVIETKVDRRAPRGTTIIPPADLKKLVNKVVPADNGVDD